MWQLDWLFPVSLFLTSNKTDSYDINELLFKNSDKCPNWKSKTKQERERYIYKTQQRDFYQVYKTI